MANHRPADPAPLGVFTQLARLLVVLAGATLAFYIYAEITGHPMDPVWQLPGDSGFIRELNTFMATEWGVVALIDVYAGFLIAIAIIIAFERKAWVGLAWGLPILFIGNVVTAVWFAIRFPELVRRLRKN